MNPCHHVQSILPGPRTSLTSRSLATALWLLMLSFGSMPPSAASEPYVAGLWPGDSLTLTFSIDGEPAHATGFEGANHGSVELEPAGAVYHPRASFFSVGSDLIHFILQGEDTASVARYSVIVVAHDRPSFDALHIDFEQGDDLQGLTQGSLERFELSAASAFEGWTGLTIHGGIGAAYLHVGSERIPRVPSEDPLGDHSSETKTEIEPPWPPAAIGSGSTGARWRVLRYLSHAGRAIEIFVHPMPEEPAYGYTVEVDGVPGPDGQLAQFGAPPHALALRTFSLPGGKGFQVSVNDVVIRQLVGSGTDLWPLASLAVGMTDAAAQTPLALDALSVRRGYLQASTELDFREPFEGNPGLAGWHVRSPEDVVVAPAASSDLEGSDDGELKVVVSKPLTEPEASVARILDHGRGDSLIRLRLDPTGVTLPVGTRLDLFESRDPAGPQTRLRLARNGAGLYKLHVLAWDDDGNWHIARSPKVDFAPMTLELRWRRSQGAIRATGRVSLWHDGRRIAWLGGLDDDERSADELRFGALGATSDEISGELRFDDLSLWTAIVE